MERFGDRSADGEIDNSFDVFVSAAQVDSDWSEWIRWVLKDARFKVAPTGVNDVRQSMRDSALVLVVVSNASLGSSQFAQEWQTAWALDSKSAPKRVIPVLVAPVDPPGILTKAKPVSLFGLEEGAARGRLTSAVTRAVRRRRSPSDKPAYPGRAATLGDLSSAEGPAHSPLASFVNRTQELETLHTLVTDERNHGRIVAVTGLAGVGKTALCLIYSELHRDHYSQIIRRSAPSSLRDLYETESASTLLILDDVADPDKALTMARRLVDARPNLDILLVTRKQVSGIPSVDLHALGFADSVELLRRRLPEAGPDKLRDLATLAGGLPQALNFAAALASQSTAGIEGAINSVKDVLDSPDVGIEGVSVGLAERYLRRYAMHGSPNDAFEAERLIRGLIRESTTPSEATGWRSTLAALLAQRHQRTGSTGDLEESIRLLREAAAQSRAGDRNLPAILSNLATALRARYDVSGSVDDLQESISLLRGATAQTSAGDPDLPAMLSNLATALRSRYDYLGSAEDLQESIALLRDAVAEAPAAHQDLPAMLSNLATALRSRYGLLNSTEDLQESVALLREAVAQTPSGHRDLPAMLSNLAAALRSKFDLLGSVKDLEESISLLRAAVAQTPVEHPDLPAMLSNLGAASLTRFEATGDRADMELAVDASARAANLTAVGDTSRSRRLASLAEILREEPLNALDLTGRQRGGDHKGLRDGDG